MANVIEAIVIKIEPLNETQKVVKTFTKELGYLCFVIPTFILKKRGEQIHPMQILEIEYNHSATSRLQRIKSTHAISQFTNLYFDIVKMNIALLWGEFLDITLREEKENTLLYEYLYSSIHYLNDITKGIGNFNLYFLYRLPTLIGFKIDNISYKDGYLFNLENGCFYPSTAQKQFIAGPNAARLIYQIISHPLDHLHLIALNQQARATLLDIITSYFSYHLNTDFRTKGMEVIRDLFQS